MVEFNNKQSVKPLGKNSGKTSGKIIALMQENPKITISEIADKLDRSQRAIELQINKMKKDKFIRRVGPAKGGDWEVLN